MQASVRASYTAFERIMTDWQRQLIAWRCGLSAAAAQEDMARQRTGTAATSRYSSTASASTNLVRSAPRRSTRSTPGFKLPADQVDAVIAAGHDALRANPTFRDFLKGIGGRARRAAFGPVEPAEPPSIPVADVPLPETPAPPSRPQ